MVITLSSNPVGKGNCVRLIDKIFLKIDSDYPRVDAGSLDLKDHTLGCAQLF